ncbi:MAG: hypothetical protein L0241_13960 [Planctomycetia bacterium]|nr:hypothetical protein [Planctomycetia bacterium]
MRNILALIGLVVVVFAGVGWYMGWYKLNVSKSEGNLQIQTDVDTKKVGADSSDFMKNVGAVIGSHVDQAAQDAKSSAPNTTPGTTPGPISAPQNTDPQLPSIPVAPTPVTPTPMPPGPALPTIPIAPIPGMNPTPIPLVPPKMN